MESGALPIVDQSPPPTWKLVSGSSMAVGVQFAWAIQISLLTPHVQTLGVPRAFSNLFWLYTAFSGMVLQPILGYKSDCCTFRFGRRRPFIAAGSVLACLSFILIGFARDIGYQTGDSPNRSMKPRAFLVFLVGFCLLDVAINTLQGPCRALLADICLTDHFSMRKAMSWFSFFMAIGNILGYTAGSFAGLHLLFPFSQTEVCDGNCANFKSCFVIAAFILLIVTLSAIISVSEIQLREEDQVVVNKHFNNNNQLLTFVKQAVPVLTHIKRPMKMLLLVTFLNWLALFPFILFGTDWVGTEVFGGKVDGDGIDLSRYEVGVRSGSLGLMANSVVVALASLALGPAVRLLGGMKNLWGLANLVLAGGLIGTVVITKKAGEWWSSKSAANDTLFPSYEILCSAWIVYIVLGISLAATYSLPFAMAAIYSSVNADGQGLSLGVLNLAMAIPQMIESIGCIPLHKVFGYSKAPSFALGAVLATMSAIIAIFMLPDSLEPATLGSTAEDLESLNSLQVLHSRSIQGSAKYAYCDDGELEK